MKDRLILFIFSLFLTLSLGSVERVLACSCSSGSICSNYNSAKYVFVGKIVKHEKQEDGYALGDVTLEVEEGLVGIKKGELLKTVSMRDAACSYAFEKGETYLVYGFSLALSNKTAARLGENAFWTTTCSRTRAVKYAAEDLIFLRNLPNDNFGGRISGKVYENDFVSNKLVEIPFDKLRINVLEVNKNSSFSLFTNSKGEFETIVPSGKYQVKPVLNRGMKFVYDDNRLFNIRSGGCINLDFEVE